MGVGVVSEHTKEELELSYLAYMQALREAFGGKHARFFQEFGKDFPIGGAIRSIPSPTMRHWFHRATVPEGEVLERLSQLVELKVATPPPGAIDTLAFDEIARLLINVRLEKTNKGKRQARLSDLNQSLLNSGALSIRPIPASDLDEKELLLGSRDFGGDVPPYCKRDVDEVLGEVLGNPVRRLLVLVGPPKSGKTRTLVEALKASALSNCPVYWLEPRQDAIAKVVNALPVTPTKSAIVVLDDLQNFKFEGDQALTPGALDDLTKRAMVVATLHDSAVKKWNLLQFDHRAETKSQLADVPSREVQRRLADNAISLNATLSFDELQNLDKVFPKSLVDAKSYLHLASELAAAEALNQKLSHALAENKAHIQSIFRGVVDAKIIWPEGATLEDLKRLSQAEHNFRSNAPWSETGWQDAITNFTESVAPNAPHAILMRTLGDRNKYSLFDALWEAHKPVRWSAEALESEPLDFLELAISAGDANYYEEAIRIASQLDNSDSDVCHFLGFFCYQLGWTTEARSWYEKSAQAGDADSNYNLGVMNEEEGRLSDAEVMYREASDAGHPGAENNLALLLENAGKLDEAEEFYRKAAEAGNTLAQYNLGLLFSKVGKLSEAEHFFRKAASEGDPEAQNNLASLLENAGKLDESEEFYRKAAEAGNTLAQNNLGLLFSKAGKLSEAERFFRKAASEGDPEAQNNLGVLLENAGKLDESEEFYRKAAEAGNTLAQNNLGVLLENAGKLDESEESYRKAAEAGNALAQKNLALMLQNAGKQQESEVFLRMSAEGGNTDAQNNLGALLENSAKLDEAEEFYRKAAEAGNTLAQNNLGFMLSKAGKLAEAEHFFRKAAEGGEPEAQNNLGVLLVKAGKPEEAKEFFLKAAEAGYVFAKTNLAISLEESGELEEAEAWYRKGAEAGDTDAQNYLGALLEESGKLEEAEAWYRKASEARNPILENSEKLFLTEPAGGIGTSMGQISNKIL
jgi:TPR repeat protein